MTTAPVTTEHTEQWRHYVLSVSEGCCPLHGPLKPVRHDATVQAGGYCSECGSWWYVNQQQSVTRETGARPVYDFGRFIGMEGVTPSWVLP